MADLLALREYVEESDLEDLRLVHHSPAAGSGWGLARRQGSVLADWLALDTDDRAEAHDIIGAVGLKATAHEDATADPDHDAVFRVDAGHDPGAPAPSE